jgi:manganese efflux pump family protein
MWKFSGTHAGAGWIIGAQFGAVVEHWDHWIALVLLAGIGGKTLWDSFGEEDVATEQGDPFGFKIIFVVAVATSLDVLAAGISMPVMGVSLLTAVVVIGLVTSVLWAELS